MIRRIGDLRHLVSFREPLPRRASSSGYIESDWRTYATDVRGRMELNANEGSFGGGRVERVTGTFSMRCPIVRRPVATEKLVWRDMTFNIDGVSDPDQKERQLELALTQVA